MRSPSSRRAERLLRELELWSAEGTALTQQNEALRKNLQALGYVD